MLVCVSGLVTAILYDIISEELKSKKREAMSQAEDHAYRMFQFLQKINLIDPHHSSSHKTTNYASRYNFRKRPMRNEKHDKT